MRIIEISMDNGATTQNNISNYKPLIFGTLSILIIPTIILTIFIIQELKLNNNIINLLIIFSLHFLIGIIFGVSTMFSSRKRLQQGNLLLSIKSAYYLGLVGTILNGLGLIFFLKNMYIPIG